MAHKTLEQRVLALERAAMTHATRGELMEVRDELRGQILQLGADMRVEFSALRAEVDETRQALGEQILMGDEETRRVLGAEIEALGTQMRVLHEDVIDRIVRLNG